MPTKIEWTDESWNPVVGCTRVSDGCRNCYAERAAARMAVNPKQPAYHGIAAFNEQHEPRWTGVLRFLPERLQVPLRWRKPRRVFTCSMSDLFHASVTDAQIAAVFGVMAATPQHTYQVLTKRPERAAEWFEVVDHLGAHRRHMALSLSRLAGDLPRRVQIGNRWPLLNVWLGTSVEDQATADERIPHLLRCPAAARFLSYEPALGPLSLRWAKWHDYYPRGWRERGEAQNHLDGARKLDWIIAGGESGPGSRPPNPNWFRGLRDQCIEAGVAFFFKQWGDWIGFEDARLLDTMDLPLLAPRFDSFDGTAAGEVVRLGKRHTGRRLDDREWNQFPRVSA